MNFLSVFPEKTKISDFRWKNADVTRTQSCVTCSIYFLDLLKLRYYRAKFCRFVRQILGRGAFLPPPSEQPRKGPSWIGLNLNMNYVHEFKILSLIYTFFESSFMGFLRRITFSFRLRKKLVDLFNAVYSFFQ